MELQSLGREDPLEKVLAIHARIIAWEIPWTVEPGGLQSTGSQRVRHSGNAGVLGSIPGSERSAKEGNGYPVFLSRESPWTEEPGRLQFMGSQRVRHN